MTTAAALSQQLLEGSPYVRDRAPHSRIAVRGADAVDFLQRLCSQDVAGMAPLELRPAAFLDAKGKVIATCLVGRLDQDVWIETQQHQQERLMALLERFHFTEKVTIAAEPSVCRERIAAASSATPSGVVREHGVTALRIARRGVLFERWHAGRTDELPTVGGEALVDDLAECLRMAAGFVRVGDDTEPGTLALEADLDDHCSRTKGCYTGQEIVARIHTYGHTNRSLCLLRLPAGTSLRQPTVLVEPDDDVPVGRVMRAVPAPGRTFAVGLGYLPRDFLAVGQRLRLQSGGDVEVAGFGDGA